MTKQHIVIAMVIHSLQAGGMERVMSELANYFSKLDRVKVHLVLFGRNMNVFYDLNCSVIVHKPEANFNNRFRAISSLKRLFYVRAAIKQINPDTVLSFGIPWNNFVLLALKRMKYPVFVSDRGSPERRFPFVHELMKRHLYKDANGIIAQTKLAKDVTLKVLPLKNIRVIGNPFRPIISNNKYLARENIILSVGRLITTKHYDRLIHIYSKLIAPGWKLIIIGKNALKQNNFEYLQQMIVDLKLTGRVILTGEQKHVEDYYVKSKIFAFTSSVEGFPNVIGEALSAGNPVISYNCIAGPSEMINDGENGFLVPVFDDDMFREKLQLLIDNEELRQKMSEKAPASIKRFSIESIGPQYLDFILS